MTVGRCDRRTVGRITVGRPDGRTVGRIIALGVILSVSPTVQLSGLQCPDGSPPPCRVAHSAPAPTSIAVLYLDNLSHDTADAYLVDGLTEAMIERLSRLERLTVKAAATVRRYREGGTDPLSAGRTLGVAYLLAGGLRRAGPRLRVNVELLRVSTGDRLWGEHYDRPTAEVQSVEADISQGVATAVIGRLLPRERAPLAARDTRDAQAYDHLLRGNFLFGQWHTESVLQRALEEYERAVRLDPGFARAYARLGLAHAEMHERQVMRGGFVTLPPESLVARGRAAAGRALELDSMVSDAWLARGRLLTGQGPDVPAQILALYARAVLLDPRSAEAHLYYGLALMNQRGDDGAADIEFRRAVELEPDQFRGLRALGNNALVQRRYAEAVIWLDSALVVQPGAAVLVDRAAAHFLLGDTAAARQDAEAALHSDFPAGGEVILALLELRTGDSTAGRARVQRILARSTGVLSEADGEAAAIGLVALGDRDRAIDLLISIQPHDARFHRFLRYAWFDPLRPDARFQRLFEESRPPGALQ